MRTAAAVALSLCAFLVSGCFDIEQALTFERNMSGKAGFTMKVDMEPMIGIMAAMKKGFEGKSGPPTAAELAEARKEFKTSKKGNLTDFEKDKAELQSQLPKGVTLLDASVKEGDLSFAVNLLLGFDDVAKLSKIDLPKKGAAPGAPGSPIDSPFGGLNVVDDGKTILVTSSVENPMADQQKEAAQMAADPAMMKMAEQMFSGVRVAFKITAPFDVIEHTAHRKEANTLIWEYNMKSLEKLTPEQLKQGILVRYRK